jgi:hypothetical protein
MDSNASCLRGDGGCGWLCSGLAQGCSLTALRKHPRQAGCAVEPVSTRARHTRRHPRSNRQCSGCICRRTEYARCASLLVLISTTCEHSGKRVWCVVRRCVLAWTGCAMAGWPPMGYPGGPPMGPPVGMGAPPGSAGPRPMYPPPSGGMLLSGPPAPPPAAVAGGPPAPPPAAADARLWTEHQAKDGRPYW